MSGYECTNRFEKGRIRFPHPVDNKELHDKWITATRLENKKIRENYYLCGDHFRAENYNNLIGSNA